MSPRRLKLQIKLCSIARLGPGKAELLEAVDRCGSITQAAKDLRMSYRRAWLLLDEMNRALTAPVIETATGGPGRGGAKLTPSGRQLLDIYARIQAKSEAAVADELAELAGLVRDEADLEEKPCTKP